MGSAVKESDKLLKEVPHINPCNAFQKVAKVGSYHSWVH